MKYIEKTLVLIALVFVIASCGTTKKVNDDKLAEGDQLMKQRIEERDEGMRNKGADFIASGIEPGWMLMIDKSSRIIELKMDGQKPQKYFLNADEYIDVHDIHVNNTTSNLIITSSEGECVDSNTGEIMLYNVVIDFNGQTYDGCGKDLRNVEHKPMIIPIELNGGWVLESLNGEIIDQVEDVFQPILDIKLKESMAIGTTGCNNFQAEIIIEGNKMSFPPFPMTQKFCEGSLESPFVKAIMKVDRYSIQDKKLLMYDNGGNEILRFKKVD
jgi:heat shock protein HslJ/uncharacterized membrane protein